MVEFQDAGSGGGRPRMISLAKAEHRVGKAKRGDRENQPAEQKDGCIGAAQPEGAAVQRQRQCVQNGKADKGVIDQERGRDDPGRHPDQPADEAECDRNA